jgi:hypothetical protein
VLLVLLLLLLLLVLVLVLLAGPLHCAAAMWLIGIKMLSVLPTPTSAAPGWLSTSGRDSR